MIHSKKRVVCLLFGFVGSGLIGFGVFLGSPPHSCQMLYFSADSYGHYECTDQPNQPMLMCRESKATNKVYLNYMRNYYFLHTQ